MDQDDGGRRRRLFVARAWSACRGFQRAHLESFGRLGRADTWLCGLAVTGASLLASCAPLRPLFQPLGCALPHNGCYAPRQACGWGSAQGCGVLTAKERIAWWSHAAAQEPPSGDRTPDSRNRPSGEMHEGIPKGEMGGRVPARNHYYALKI